MRKVRLGIGEPRYTGGVPTYEYRCSACAHEWEAEQSIRASALTECPRCHEQTARRQISHSSGFGRTAMPSLGRTGTSSVPARTPLSGPASPGCCTKR